MQERLWVCLPKERYIIDKYNNKSDLTTSSVHGANWERRFGRLALRLKPSMQESDHYFVNNGFNRCFLTNIIICYMSTVYNDTDTGSNLEFNVRKPDVFLQQVTEVQWPIVLPRPLSWRVLQLLALPGQVPAYIQELCSIFKSTRSATAARSAIHGDM